MHVHDFFVVCVWGGGGVGGGSTVGGREGGLQRHYKDAITTLRTISINKRKPTVRCTTNLCDSVIRYIFKKNSNMYCSRGCKTMQNVLVQERLVGGWVE